MSFFEKNADGLAGLIRGATAFFASHAKKEKAIAVQIEAKNKAAEEARAAAEAAAAAAENAPPPIFRDRAALIALSDLDTSLMGSYFMFKDMGEVEMIGLVLHEVHSPVNPDAAYLLQLYDGMLGQKSKQIIVPQSRMLYGHVSDEADRMGLKGELTEWSFYDTDEELTLAWQEHCLAESRQESTAYPPVNT